MSNSTVNTQLLLAARGGDRGAFDQLFEVVYSDLRGAAHQRLLGQQVGGTLNTTALVHETYLRLVDRRQLSLQDRAHFLALASRAMRYVLIDYVRARGAQKRGGDAVLLTLDALEVPEGGSGHELLALNEALEELLRFSPRLAQLVEYRFFGGLSHEEIAEINGVSLSTVKRDWIRARTWLFQALQTEGDAVDSNPTVSGGT